MIDEISEDYLGGRNVMNGHVHQGAEEERTSYMHERLT